MTNNRNEKELFAEAMRRATPAKFSTPLPEVRETQKATANWLNKYLGENNSRKYNHDRNKHER